MKTLFISFLFLLVVSSGTLPSTKGVIYHSITNESVVVTLNNSATCTEVISCGEFKDSTLLEIWRGQPNTRILTIQTNGQDVYGWSNGNVTYTVK